MTKQKQPKIRIQQTVKTTRFVPGYPVGLPTDALVTVTATGSGRFQVEAASGNRYWVDSDAIAPLG